MIEGPAFYPSLSGRRNLEVLAVLGGHPRTRIGQMLELVGLADRADERYDACSLGMKQRLGIAAALLPDPALPVLDEPANGLDPAGIIEIRSHRPPVPSRPPRPFASPPAQLNGHVGGPAGHRSPPVMCRVVAIGRSLASSEAYGTPSKIPGAPDFCLVL
jgi:ABC transporter